MIIQTNQKTCITKSHKLTNIIIHPIYSRRTINQVETGIEPE